MIHQSREAEREEVYVCLVVQVKRSRESVMVMTEGKRKRKFCVWRRVEVAEGSG